MEPALYLLLPMQDVTIRRATALDIPQLLPLMRGLAEYEHYLDVFAVDEQVLLRQGFTQSPPGFYCLVADSQGDLVGMLVYYLIPFTATATPALFVKELFVTEAARGFRVGEQLMAAVARAAVDVGCGAVRWAVADWNEGGKRFYERLGARPNPVWIDYSLSGDALATLAQQSAPKP